MEKHKNHNTNDFSEPDEREVSSQNIVPDEEDEKETLIRELSNAAEELMKMVRELKEENQFLTEVIVKHRLARKVIEERKQRRNKQDALKGEDDIEEGLDPDLPLAERIVRAKKL